MNNIDINGAESWAAGLWDDARVRWCRRAGQDLNYRSQVIDPTLRWLLAGHVDGPGARVLDLGCGDGILLDGFVGRDLVGLDGTGRYLGVDRSPDAVAAAQERHRDAPASFIEGDLTDPALPGRIARHGTVWDLMLSVFVFQEIPDLASVLAGIGRIAGTGATGLFVVVDPSFAEWLVEAGRMTIEPESPDWDGGLWRWRAAYPIVDEPGCAFYLPYFHRTVEMYRDMLAAAGFALDRVAGIPDAVEDLHRLRRSGMPPFVPYPENLYWPRIAEAPSSLAFLVRKE